MAELLVDIKIKDWSVDSHRRELKIQVGINPLGVEREFIKEYWLSRESLQIGQEWRGLTTYWMKSHANNAELVCVLDKLIRADFMLSSIEDAMIRYAEIQLHDYVKSREQDLALKHQLLGKVNIET